jgi:hypothetical protein
LQALAKVTESDGDWLDAIFTVFLICIDTRLHDVHCLVIKISENKAASLAGYFRRRGRRKHIDLS